MRLKRDDLSVEVQSATPTRASPSVTSPPTSTSASASASASSSSGSNNGFFSSTSFVGNAPSTVLFFLALAVGVFIGILFVYFTIRYFVRSSYGLHAYPITHRQSLAHNAMLDSTYTNSRLPARSGFLMSNPTDEELQEQLDFFREYAARNGLSHRVYPSAESRRRIRNRRRNRRGRFARMKKLSEREVEILFPKKTYHDWLDGGKERDSAKRDGILQEEERLSLAETDTAMATVDRHRVSKELNSSVSPDGDEVHEITPTKSVPVAVKVSSKVSATTVNSDAIELDELDPISRGTSAIATTEGESNDEDLHFTSGTCAICLELLEEEDMVRGLICGHVFHSECLDPWLIKRRACCPMCKRDYFFKDPSKEGTTEENTNAASSDNNNEDNPESGTATNNINNDDDIDNDSIDFEALRNDPALRALIQEMIPMEERVRLVLNDESIAHLRIEEKATEIADFKYKSIWKRIWFRAMGVRKPHIFHWAVMKIYLDHKEEVREAYAIRNRETAEREIARNLVTVEGPFTEDGVAPTLLDASPEPEAEEAEEGAEQGAEQEEEEEGTPAPSDSIVEEDLSEIDIHSETTRNVVDQRV